MASSDEEGRKETKMPSSGEWCIDAVYSLIERYGQKFAVGRGFLRNKDWEDVVAAVNSGCGDARFRKTMKQCRDKIDSLKKRYKVEKRRALDTGLTVTAWPYFVQMDEVMSYCAPKNQARDSGSIPSADKSSTPPHDVERLAGPCDEKKMESLGLEFREKMESLGLGFRKRSRDEMSCDPFEALTEAIVGFSDVYARIEIAKMEILADMNSQLAKIGRRKKRRNNGHYCDGRDSEQNRSRKI